MRVSLLVKQAEKKNKNLKPVIKATIQELRGILIKPPLSP